MYDYVTTSIKPRDIFSNQQTAYQRNNAVAQALAGSNPYEAYKGFDRPGMSRGAGTRRSIAPTMMQGRAQAAEASAMVPFADAAANARNMLSGQVARENEAQGLTGINQQMIDLQNNRDLVNQQNSLSILRALMGI